MLDIDLDDGDVDVRVEAESRAGGGVGRQAVEVDVGLLVVWRGGCRGGVDVEGDLLLLLLLLLLAEAVVGVLVLLLLLLLVGVWVETTTAAAVVLLLLLLLVRGYTVASPVPAAIHKARVVATTALLREALVAAEVLGLIGSSTLRPVVLVAVVAWVVLLVCCDKGGEAGEEDGLGQHVGC